jgi:hypothetical protein
MTTSSNNSGENKAAVSIKEMAALCGLSRQRFMQLVKAGVFPAPLYDVGTKRPFYPEDLQTICLEVRRRNCGINGKVVMFYARRSSTPSAAPAEKFKKPKSKPGEVGRDADILEGLRGLGMVTATAARVAEAVGELFPQGTGTTDPAEVIRAVFLHLRRKN